MTVMVPVAKDCGSVKRPWAHAIPLPQEAQVWCLYEFLDSE